MKYTYYGMTIPEYCAKHNLNCKSIYSRLKYLKNKNPNLSDHELLSIVFNTERLTKYTYKGMSIKEYCAKNNISSDYLYHCLAYLKTLNLDLSNEELIKLAIESPDLPKYIYEGKHLAEYCVNHNLSFKTIYNRICKLRKEHPELSTEELVNLAFKRKLNPLVKYTYQGISLYEYCAQNNINLFTIYSRMRKLKQENTQISDEVLINEALTRNLAEEQIIYFWNDTPLVDYCRTHPEVNISSIRGWICKELKKNPHQSIESLIEAYINGLNNKNRWFYLGIHLKTFCDNNDISYESIRSYLFKMLRNPIYSNWSDNDLVEYLVEKRFPINGKNLKDYCASINFPYETMHEILKEKLKKTPDTKFKTILMSTIITINQYYLINYETIKHYPEEINTYLKDSTNEYLRNNLKNNVNTLTLIR